MRRLQSQVITPRISLSRVAAVVLLSASLCGCARSPRASVAHLWDRVPSLRWPGGDDAADEELSTPKVTANVAGSAASEETASEPTASMDQDAGDLEDAFAALPEFARDEVPAHTETEHDPVAWLTTATDVPPLEQRIHDLKAALTADTERQPPESSTFSGPHPLRLRVDGLLRRAYEQLQADQWDEARRTTLLAVDLSDKASLEFLPNEDRPGDLLRQIDAHLEARRDSARVPAESQSPVAAPQLPPSLEDAGPIASVTTPPASRVIPAIQQTAGMDAVAANYPLSVHAAPDEKASPSSAAEVVTLPALPPLKSPARESDIRVALAEAPVAFHREAQWTPPALEPAATPVPHAAPKPPMIDEIEPLPLYREPQTTAPPPIDSPIGVAAAHWSDWLAAGVLLLLLSACGLALGARRWWCGH